jgi:hypothetical protein
LSQGVVHTCNPSTWETEAGGSEVRGQTGIHGKILSQKQQKKENKEKGRKEGYLGLGL